MSFDLDPTNFNQAIPNRNSTFSQSDVSQYDNSGLDVVSTSSSASFIGGDYTTVSSANAEVNTGADAGLGAGNYADALFDMIDRNRNGLIERSEFNQWRNNVSVSESVSGPVNGSVVSSISSKECIPPTYETDANGHYRDPNPRVENRANTSPSLNYLQNIRIRFLQPPPLPPIPPRFIKEVRPPLPLSQPPVHKTVRSPDPPELPALVLRERPPQRPVVNIGKNETVLLPPYPPVPRSVITEVYPPAPPRPRNIDLIRWIPYGPQAKQAVIRIPAPCEPYPDPPRNTIIKYGPVQARVVRQFQRLAITQVDPEAYIQQYGSSLLDSATFIQQARAAGVFEDISPPPYSASLQSSSTGFLASPQLVGSAGINAASSSEIVTTSEGFGGGFGAADTAFDNADLNKNGTRDAAELSSFVQ